MGRKRKTRWRRLSIGGNSGNEEEEADGESEILGFSKMNPASRHRSGSQPSITNSYSTFDQSSPIPVMNGTPKYSTTQSQTPGELKSNDESTIRNGYSSSSQRDSSHTTSTHHPHHHHNGRGDHHQYTNGYTNQNTHHYSHYTGKDRGDGSYQSNNSYNSQSNGGSGYYPSSNYYHHRNSYNQYRGSNNYEGGGYRGRGDYHNSSRFGGRFRKPRPYASNYYYNNPPSNQDEGGTNRPSYNQEEYTKITTPRQDVLFKKGYLSQRKPVTQSSSVDSTSGPTTPSTNGTPDTHSTNGVNSDFSEGYENGETDCGVLPYDDTVYYGPPPETAVFTDPNTGQVYYGQSNGEYFDAYPVSPVMVGGYPTPLYYHLPYTGLDWNGIPTPIYPLVPIGPPPPLDEQTALQPLQSGYPYGHKLESVKGTTTTTTMSLSESNAGDPDVKGITKKSDSTPTPLTNGTHKNSKVTDKSGSKKVGDGGRNGTLSDSSTSSSREGSTSTLSSAASTPLSPPVNCGGGNGQLSHLTTAMSNINLNDPSSMAHFHHQTIHHLHEGIPPPIPMSHFLAHPVPPPPHHHHHHHQQILYHPHPAFVYAPPIYNGVVVPIAPAASTTESQSSPSSRKKRKLRRRKKDDGQLTDESSSEESTISAEEPKDPIQNSQLTSKTNNYNEENVSSLLPVSSTSSQLTSPESSPTKSNSLAKTKKDFIENPTTTNPEEPTTTTTTTTHLQLAPPEARSFSGNKIELEQIPLEAEEVVKPDQEEKPPGGVEPVELNPTQVSSEEEPGDTAGETTTLNLSSSKNPLGLSLGTGGLESNSVSLLQLLKSPDTLEPSSPDSFNTTQSVAGSEVPSVSVSETDFMNRTTSVDEVEEDLPPEEFLLEASPPETERSDTTIQLQSSHCTESETDSETSRSPEHRRRDQDNTIDSTYPHDGLIDELPILPIRSSPILIKSIEDSPDVGSPNEITETSPSPETIFERKLELPLPFLSELKLETQESLIFQPIEPTQLLSIEVRDLVDAIQVEGTELSQERPSVTTTVPFSLASDDVQCVQIYEPTITLRNETPPSCSSPIGRPQSITLAVSQWLKTQGDDALTPVNQLQAFFEDIDEDDETGTDEDDGENGLEVSSESGKNPKNTSAPSNCRIQ